MSEIVWIATLKAGLDGAARAAFADAVRASTAAMGAAHSLVEASAPGGREAGDLIVRLGFTDEGAWELAAEQLETLGLDDRHAGMLAGLDGAAYRIARSGGVSPRAGVFRTALFAANRRPGRRRIAMFEAETAAMPRQVAAIRGWALGAVTRSCGRFGWTHVWEQTFDDLEGLTKTYMNHPCHWGQVDRWFDPEHPDWLIDPGLCHAFCASGDLPALGAG
ncbi:MAG: hypothetical protein JWP35_3395 [Caulobacter sp.]|nr:hypothetical protein [Caulobacter sp.]